MLAVIFTIFAICLVIERVFAGWNLTQVRTWPLRVIGVNLLQFGVVILAGRSWEIWLARRSLFDLGYYAGPIAGGLIAYVIATFVFYWWHRWRHESWPLWRLFHQIHHSPQRIEVMTSFHKHPIEMIANSIISACLVYTLLGLSIEGGAVYTLCTALGEFFYHTNFRTPRWIGFLFQRPEMHRIHHQHRRHRNNYGDITWWDMLFGTYENPPDFSKSCGFEDAQEQRLIDMVLFRDVLKRHDTGL